MTEKVVRIKLKCLESDWEHDIELVFEDEKTMYENFVNPIEATRKANTYEKVVLKVAEGIVGRVSHFETDCRKYRQFEISVNDKILIKNVSFDYEKGDNEGAPYDEMWMKNIVIQFNARDCQFHDQG